MIQHLIVGALITISASWNPQPTASNPPECSDQLLGAWTGMLDTDALFEFGFEIRGTRSNHWTANITAGSEVEELATVREGDRVGFRSAAFPISFDGRLVAGGSILDGFVHHGSSLAHTQIQAESDLKWTTNWNLLGTSVGTQPFDLYVERENGVVSGAYFFFRDQRLPVLFGLGIACSDGKVTLKERNLSLEFEGNYDPALDVIELSVTGPAGSTLIVFRRVDNSEIPDTPDSPFAPPRLVGQTGKDLRSPASLDDGWTTAHPEDEGLDVAPINKMIRAIVDRELDYTHAVLVARGGRLVIEEYFYGFDASDWHDMRSASKTITSTLIGLGIDVGAIPEADAKMLSFFPRLRHPANWDYRKSLISIRHLLTMSSGLDANDSDRNSAAAEGRYQSQQREPDWIRLALDAPMIDDPGNQPLYGGANPMILGGILDESVQEPVEWFAHRTLFEPLGISRYKWFLDPLGRLYMGGGLHLRPRDMLKYGQMYLNGGTWHGERILSKEWIDASWKQYGRLAPLDRNGHQYGFLWWHHQYAVEGQVIRTMEARGYGSQYIFVIPELDMVVVIVGGNFRNGRTRQPEEILGEFLLPAAVQ